MRLCPDSPYRDQYRSACFKGISFWSRLRKRWHEATPRIDLGDWPER